MTRSFTHCPFSARYATTDCEPKYTTSLYSPSSSGVSVGNHAGTGVAVGSGVSVGAGVGASVGFGTGSAVGAGVAPISSTTVCPFGSGSAAGSACLQAKNAVIAVRTSSSAAIRRYGMVRSCSFEFSHSIILHVQESDKPLAS